MNVDRLYEILNETAFEFRKGDVFEGSPGLVAQAEKIARGDAAAAERGLQGGGVLHVYNMPHEGEAPAEFVKVDVEFEVIGVDLRKAEEHREDLIALLGAYPQPERLAGGPSYIEVGGVIGSQSGAFRLFALGEALGLWKVITPATMGFSGAEARELAGSGFVMITGYRPAPRDAERQVAAA